MKTKQDEVTAEFQKSSLAVSELTNEHTTVSEQLEEIKVRSLLLRGGCCSLLL